MVVCPGFWFQNKYTFTLKPHQIYMKKRIRTITLLLFLYGAAMPAKAQLSISAQLRTRTEFRDGQGAPIPKGTKPAIFTSQRSRLLFRYSMYRLKFGVTVQDVRVWGQDVSTINRTTTQDLNAFMLHEAWAEIVLTDTSSKKKSLKLKIGRQELVYDDQRLLGNLDWLQQGRRHDAALLKYETQNWMFHIGAAFNQNKENASGTIYNSTPPGNYAATTNGGSMYKSLQFLYAGKKLNKGNASFLFLTDQFSKFHADTALQSEKIFETGTWSRATTGLYFNNSFNKLTFTASAYYQFGKNASGQNLTAGLVSGAAQYSFTKKFNAGAGIDYYSGGNKGTTSHAFDPLYGTPHKFAGLMDYYYAANPFGKNGLVDYYVKARYKPCLQFLLAADLHQFNSAAKLSGYTKNLGQEFDITGSYSLTKQISFEAGYAHYFITSLLTSASVKNVANSKPSANWAYLMINVNPEVLSK